MISGQDDGSTPPLLASNALKYLTHGGQVSIPNYGHQLDSPCVWSIMMQFIEAGTAENLDTSCTSQVCRPPFATDVAEQGLGR